MERTKEFCEENPELVQELSLKIKRDKQNEELMRIVLSNKNKEKLLITYNEIELEVEKLIIAIIKDLPKRLEFMAIEWLQQQKRKQTNYWKLIEKLPKDRAKDLTFEDYDGRVITLEYLIKVLSKGGNQ